MESNHYLSIGTKLGGHYEIEKVLSEDDFEILYLAKDLHKRGEYVVLKELFLKAYSQRDGKEVKTLAKSKIIFEETKKEVIKEVEVLLNNSSIEKAATYGSFEENNTVYTIMEFINNSNLDGYLKINKIEKPNEVTNTEPLKRDVMKEEIIEPTPKKSVSLEKKEKPKSSLFLKILITSLLICLGLGYYAYNMIKEDKQKIKERPPKAIAVKEIPKPQAKNLPTSKEELLNDYVEGSNEIVDNDDEEIIKETPEGAAYITDVEAYKKEQEAKEAQKRAEEEAQEKALEDEEERLREEEYKRMQDEALQNEVYDNETIPNTQNHEEFIPENIREFIGEEEESSNHPENDVPPLSEDAKEILPLGAKTDNSLGTTINSSQTQETFSHSSLGKKIQ